MSNGHYIAEDAGGDPNLWRADGTSLFARYQNPELWDLLIAGRFPVWDDLAAKHGLETDR